MLLRDHDAAPVDPRPDLGRAGTRKGTNGVSTTCNNKDSIIIMIIIIIMILMITIIIIIIIRMIISNGVSTNGVTA